MESTVVPGSKYSNTGMMGDTQTHSGNKIVNVNSWRKC